MADGSDHVSRHNINSLNTHHNARKTTISARKTAKMSVPGDLSSGTWQAYRMYIVDGPIGGIEANDLSQKPIVVLNLPRCNIFSAPARGGAAGPGADRD